MAGYCEFIEDNEASPRIWKLRFNALWRMSQHLHIPPVRKELLERYIALGAEEDSCFLQTWDACCSRSQRRATHAQVKQHKKIGLSTLVLDRTWRRWPTSCVSMVASCFRAPGT